MAEIKRTELVWAGKYDEKGQPKPVERIILPFQVVETINESKADREKAQQDWLTGQASVASKDLRVRKHHPTQDRRPKARIKRGAAIDGARQSR